MGREFPMGRQKLGAEYGQGKAIVNNPIKLGIKFPKYVNLGPEEQAVLTRGITAVIARLQEKGVIPGAATLDTLLDNPRLMQLFMAKFRDNRDLTRDLVVDKTGKPVDGENEPLHCGLSLAQVERWLVFACAEKAFAETVKSTGGAFPAEIKAHLAFAWQLPLLEAYKRPDVSIYFRELGEGMLLLKTAAAVEAIVTTDIADLRKAREAVGGRFEEMLKTAPQAVKALSRCGEKQFAFYEKVAGDRIWRFFGGENQQLVVELLALDAKRVLALGPNFADLCIESYRLLEEIPTPTLVPFMKSMSAAFGGSGRTLLNEPQFAERFLRGVIDDFRTMEAETEKQINAVTEAAVMKWDVVKPQIAQWIKSRG